MSPRRADDRRRCEGLAQKLAVTEAVARDAKRRLEESGPSSPALLVSKAGRGSVHQKRSRIGIRGEVSVVWFQWCFPKKDIKER